MLAKNLDVSDLADRPLIEEMRYGSPLEDFLSIRTGPDRIPVNAFRESLLRIRWAAYWYRDHIWCADPKCTVCNACPSGGEGVCIVQFADGSFGRFLLNSIGASCPIAWDETRFQRIFREEVDAARQEGREHPDEQAAKWQVGLDAVRGLWRAFSFAEAQGMIIGESAVRSPE